MGPLETSLPDPIVDSLARAYWRPICAYLHAQWGFSPDGAEDLTQDFFLALCSGIILSREELQRGGLRSALLRSLDDMARSRSRERSERPGERTFRTEWACSLLEDALEELRRECERDGTISTLHLLLSKDLMEKPGRSGVAHPETLAGIRGRLMELLHRQVRKSAERLREIDARTKALLLR